jgi:hypothetical protein
MFFSDEEVSFFCNDKANNRIAGNRKRLYLLPQSQNTCTEDLVLSEALQPTMSPAYRCEAQLACLMCCVDHLDPPPTSLSV